MKNISSNPRLDSIILKIKKIGYSLTPQRYEIIRILVESRNHPSANDIYNQIKLTYPMVSLNTVYKNLAMLSTLHEIREIKTLQDAVHFDGDISPHGHVICENCGKIEDIEIKEDCLENFLKTHITDKFYGTEAYRIRGYNIEFYGLCRHCIDARATSLKHQI